MSSLFGGKEVARTIRNKVVEALLETNAVGRNGNNEPIVNDQHFQGPLRWLAQILRQSNRNEFMYNKEDLFPYVVTHLLLQFTTSTTLQKNCAKFLDDKDDNLVIFLKKYIEDKTITPNTVTMMVTVLQTKELSEIALGKKLLKVFQTFEPKLLQVAANFVYSGCQKAAMWFQDGLLQIKSTPILPMGVYNDDAPQMDTDQDGPIETYNQYIALANTSPQEDFEDFKKCNPGHSEEVLRAVYDDFIQRTLPISEDVQQNQRVTTKYFDKSAEEMLTMLATEEIQFAGPGHPLMQRPFNCLGLDNRVAEQILNGHLNIRLFEYFNAETGRTEYIIIDGNNSIIAWLRGLNANKAFKVVLKGVETVWTPAMVGTMYNISVFHCAAMTGPLHLVLEIVDGMKKSEPQPAYAPMNPGRILELLRAYGFCGLKEHAVYHCFLFQTITSFFFCQLHVTASLDKDQIEKLAVSCFKQLETIQDEKNDFQALPEKAQDFVRIAYNISTWTKQQKGMNQNQRIHLLLSMVHAVLFFSIGGSGLDTDKIDDRNAENLLDQAIETLTDKANIDKEASDEAKKDKANEVLQDPKKALTTRMSRFVAWYWVAFHALRDLKNDIPAVCRYAALFAEMIQRVQDEGTEIEITADTIKNMWGLIHIPLTVPKNASDMGTAKVEKVKTLHATFLKMKILRAFCEKGPKHNPGRTEAYVAVLKDACTALRTFLTDDEMAQVILPKKIVTAPPVDDKSSTGEGSKDVPASEDKSSTGEGSKDVPASEDTKKRKLG